MYVSFIDLRKVHANFVVGLCIKIDNIFMYDIIISVLLKLLFLFIEYHFVFFIIC